jgi:hypothetical protein
VRVRALASLIGRNQWKRQPCKANVSAHVRDAIAARGIVEDRKLVAIADDGWQTDGAFGPGAIVAVENNGFVGRIPMLEVFAPVDPDCICVLDSAALTATLDRRLSNV